jgi:hypothetical protein
VVSRSVAEGRIALFYAVLDFGDGFARAVVVELATRSTTYRRMVLAASGAGLLCGGLHFGLDWRPLSDPLSSAGIRRA